MSFKRDSTVLGIFLHIVFCWGFPYNGSLTCVSILSQHVGNLKKFVIELGGQGERGMLEGGTTTVTPSNLCAHVNSLRWHSHNRHLELGVCVLMSMLERWCNHNLHLETWVCSCQCLEVAQR